MNRLEAIRGRRKALWPVNNWVQIPPLTENVGLTDSQYAKDMDLLLAVAEAAIAEWDTHRIWQEADDSLEDTDEAWDAVWQRIDAAHEAFRAAIARLLEETDA